MAKEELYAVSRDSFELDNLVGDEQHLILLHKMQVRIKIFPEQIYDRGLEKGSREIEMAFENHGKESL